METTDPIVIGRSDFGALIEALQARGYSVIGPTVRDQAIVYEEIQSDEDLPAGWIDEQEAGHYRLRRRDDGALFGYVVGPRSWKEFLHPPRVKLVSAERDAEGAVRFEAGDTDEPPRRAFLGVRSCELHAIAIQDRVFLGNGVTDSHYEKRRRNIFTVAVNCGTAGGTCFCVSMNTGPKVQRRTPYDIALTELLDGPGGHRFVLEAGSKVGAEVLADLPSRPALAEDLGQAETVVTATAGRMGRKLDTDQLPKLLLANLEHPRWDEVAERCLTCANCTMVCPTCFCTTVEDVTDVTGDHAERWRSWDSCFTMGFTWMHGGSARQSGRSRYRQWLTHKLATWHDQFGSSGCVGCGRCITWCPVGIDLTEEAAALRESKTDPVAP
jgi:sulfhydrogenase subunit beta (sulfur reductase)